MQKKKILANMTFTFTGHLGKTLDHRSRGDTVEGADTHNIHTTKFKKAGESSARNSGGPVSGGGWLRVAVGAGTS